MPTHQVGSELIPVAIQAQCEIDHARSKVQTRPCLSMAVQLHVLQVPVSMACCASLQIRT